MPKFTRYAVALDDDTFLTSVDEDGYTIVPLFETKQDANEAAERSDLDDWRVVPVTLTN